VDVNVRQVSAARREWSLETPVVAGRNTTRTTQSHMIRALSGLDGQNFGLRRTRKWRLRTTTSTFESGKFSTCWKTVHVYFGRRRCRDKSDVDEGFGPEQQRTWRRHYDTKGLPRSGGVTDL
jgi:bisphosphoglycerate-dependent phosphoglycerate mutase